MKYLVVLVLCCFSVSAFADRCVYQAVRVAKKLITYNRESFRTVEVDKAKIVNDGVNTDNTVYSLTGRDRHGNPSTLTYELTFSNEGCIVTAFRVTGGN